MAPGNRSGTYDHPIVGHRIVSYCCIVQINVSAVASTRTVRDRYDDGRYALVDCLFGLRERFTDHLTALRTGELDLSLLRPPYGADELTGIDLVELWSERRVAVVPADHRLAGRDAIGFDELAGETFVRVPDAVSLTWRAFWQVAERRPNGRASRLADEVVDSVEEVLTVVAAGRAISLTHESVGRFYARPSVRFVPVHDISPSVLALGWRADDHTPAVRDFAAAALAVVDGEATSPRFPSRA